MSVEGTGSADAAQVAEADGAPVPYSGVEESNVASVAELSGAAAAATPVVSTTAAPPVEQSESHEFMLELHIPKAFPTVCVEVNRLQGFIWKSWRCLAMIQGWFVDLRL